MNIQTIWPTIGNFLKNLMKRAWKEVRCKPIASLSFVIAVITLCFIYCQYNEEQGNKKNTLNSVDHLNCSRATYTINILQDPNATTTIPGFEYVITPYQEIGFISQIYGKNKASKYLEALKQITHANFIMQMLRDLYIQKTSTVSIEETNRINLSAEKKREELLERVKSIFEQLECEKVLQE